MRRRLVRQIDVLQLVICSRNRVPGPGSKIPYPVPKPGNNYPVFVTIVHNTISFGLVFTCVHEMSVVLLVNNSIISEL